MAQVLTITSANSLVTLAIPGLFPTPVVLQGYKADAAFDADDVEPTETVMGVDGKLSGGYTPYPTMLTISLMPDSLSSRLFEDWQSAQKALNEALPCSMSVTIPGIARAYTLSRGFLSRIKPIPGAKKVLEGRDFRITFESCDPASI